MELAGGGVAGGVTQARHTEFPFTLPHGLVAPDGTVHREGTMRMATALDEIEPIKDPRVRSNPAIWSSSC